MIRSREKSCVPVYLQQGEDKHHFAKEVTSQNAADYAQPDE